MAPHQQRLEVAGWLEDLEGDVGHRAVVHLDPQRPLSLDPGETLHADRAGCTGPVAHCRSSLGDRRLVRPKATGTGPPWAEDSSRNGGAPALKVAKSRETSRAGVPVAAQLRRQRRGVGGVRRAEAAEAAPAHRGTQCATARSGDRAQARRAPGHEQAHRAPPLALLADGVPGDDRAASGQGGGDHLEELAPIDGTAVELVVHLDVGRDGRRRLERGHVLGMGVDRRRILAGGSEVPQSLDPTGGGAGPDGDQPAGAGPDGHDPLGVGGVVIEPSTRDRS